MIGETVFETAAHVAVAGANAVPCSAAANHDIRSQVPGADRITEDQVAAARHVLSGSTIGIPLGFKSHTDVAAEEVVEAKATTGTGVETAVPGTDDSGIESIDLEFLVTEDTGGRSDDSLGILEGFPVTRLKRGNQGHKGYER